MPKGSGPIDDIGRTAVRGSTCRSTSVSTRGDVADVAGGACARSAAPRVPSPWAEGGVPLPEHTLPPAAPRCHTKPPPTSNAVRRPQSHHALRSSASGFDGPGGRPGSAPEESASAPRIPDPIGTPRSGRSRIETKLLSKYSVANDSRQCATRANDDDLSARATILQIPHFCRAAGSVRSRAAAPSDLYVQRMVASAPCSVSSGDVSSRSARSSARSACRGAAARSESS